MSKSPLSGAFAGSSEPAKKNKKNGALLLISGIALATSIGGVFAANSITLNNEEAIEFGQGVGEVDVCSSTATTSITQTFDETANSGAGEFYVGSVTLTIPAGNATACNGKEATVTLVVDDGAAVTTATVDAEVIASGAATFDFSASSIVAGNVTDVAVTTADAD
jgi:hypothetical protein